MNRSGGISIRPATIEVNARMTGIIRPTGTAHAPLPARNRSARSTSVRVISTYLPSRSTSGRPPQRPTENEANEPASSASVPMMMTRIRLRWPWKASTPAKPNVISEEIGMQHASRNPNRMSAP